MHLAVIAKTSTKIAFNGFIGMFMLLEEYIIKSESMDTF